MKIIFLGTPDFALQPLTQLYNSRHEVLAVVTQPDKPIGRGHKVQSPPTKILAQKLGIEVLQFERIKNSDAIEQLAALNADIMVTAAYGQILNRRVLNVCPHGVINIHASLLPKYRGAAPIQWAVMMGERQSGITIMQTDIGVDSGDILLQKKLSIGEYETAGELFGRLSQLGADALLEALDLIERGQANPTKQDEQQATHFPMLRKTDGEVNWSMSAHQIKCKIYGLNPWPGAYTYLDNQIIKLWGAQCLPEGSLIAGSVITANQKDGLVVACGSGSVRILELQREGGKRMSAADFLRGNAIPVGTVFSSQL